MLPKGFNFTSRTVPTTTESVQAAHVTERQEYIDHEVSGGFGPSGIPQRVAFKLIPAIAAVEREITELSQGKSNEPPEMASVALNDSLFRKSPRVHSTLVVKRKGVDSYKGRLCVRGDTSPLQTKSFVSSPTAHRCSVN